MTTDDSARESEQPDQATWSFHLTVSWDPYDAALTRILWNPASSGFRMKTNPFVTDLLGPGSTPADVVRWKVDDFSRGEEDPPSIRAELLAIDQDEQMEMSLAEELAEALSWHTCGAGRSCHPVPRPSSTRTNRTATTIGTPAGTSQSAP